jgi:hypothetical protein
MGLVWLLGGGKSLLDARGGMDSGGVSKTASNAGSFGASNSRFAAAPANIADLMDRQPLVLGAIGLGVGAAIAAPFLRLRSKPTCSVKRAPTFSRGLARSQER